LQKSINKGAPDEHWQCNSFSSDWGCLEFNDGKVDIEAKTFYNYRKARIPYDNLGKKLNRHLKNIP